MTYDKLKPVKDLLTKVTDMIVAEFFVKAQMDVGKVGILIAKHRGAFGYCYVDNNWTVGADELREIALTPDCLIKGEAQIVNTLIHELCHAYNSNMGIHDCNGKVHTKKYKDACDKVGLGTQKVPKIGWHTSPEYNSDEFNLRIEQMLTGLTEDERHLLNNIATVLPNEEEKKKKNKNLLVYVCPECGQKIRGKHELNVICGDCNVTFEVKDDGEA